MQIQNTIATYPLVIKIIYNYYTMQVLVSCHFIYILVQGFAEKQKQKCNN